MRTRTQSTNRYFAAVWSVWLLVLGACVVAIASASEPISNWTLVTTLALMSVCAGGVGFFHGVTVMHAKQLDVQDALAVMEEYDEEDCGDHVG